MTNEIMELIRSTLLLRKDQVTPESTIESFVHDSMDIVELIAVLTNTYKITFRSADIAGLKTVADVVRYVEKHRQTTKTSHPLDGF
ncbi:MAG: acyl carrier protein [Minisyncoccota bacterium]